VLCSVAVPETMKELSKRNAAKLLLICNTLSNLPKTKDYASNKSIPYTDLILYSTAKLTDICARLSR